MRIDEQRVKTLGVRFLTVKKAFAIDAVRTGHTYDEVAEVVKVDRQTVRSWCASKAALAPSARARMRGAG